MDRRLVDRLGTADVTSPEPPSRYHVKLPPMSPLHAEAAAVQRPSPKTIAPLPTSPSMLGLSSSPLLAGISAEAAERQARLCDARWKALLVLCKLQKHNPWLPSLTTVVNSADEVAPSGLLEAETLEVLLSRLYSMTMSRSFAGLPPQHARITAGIGGSAGHYTHGGADGSGSPGSARVNGRLALSPLGAAAAARFAHQSSQQQFLIPGVMQVDDASIMEFLSKGAYPIPVAALREREYAGKGEASAAIVGPDARAPTGVVAAVESEAVRLQAMILGHRAGGGGGSSKKKKKKKGGADDSSDGWIREQGTAFAEIAGLWRHLFRGFTVRDAVGSLRMDFKQIGAALAMLDTMKKCKNIRFVVLDGLKYMAFYRGDGTLSKGDLETVLLLLCRTAADSQRVIAALDEALIAAFSTPYKAGYPTLSKRLALDTIRSKVLNQASLDAVLGPHPLSTPTIPLSVLEMMTPEPLKEFIVHRKSKRAKVAAAMDYLNQKTKRKVFAALHHHARTARMRRRAMRRLIKLAQARDNGRTVVAFTLWRQWAVYMRAVQRVQGFARMIVAWREMKRQSARIYLAEQLYKLWKSRRLLLATLNRRSMRRNAAMKLQSLFRGHKARKTVADIAKEAVAAAKARKFAWLTRSNEVRRAEGARFIQRAWRKHVYRKEVRAGMRFLAKAARKHKASQIGRTQIEAEVAAKKEDRQALDAMLARKYRSAAVTATATAAASAAPTSPTAGKVASGNKSGGSGSAAVAAAVAKLSAAAAVATPSPTQLQRSKSGDMSRFMLFYKNKSPRSDEDGYASPSAGSGGGGDGATSPLPGPVRRAVRVLQRFAIMVIARTQMRRLLVGRVERLFAYDPCQYYYRWLPGVASTAAPELTWRRPRLLGAKHELAIPDTWQARWDPRVPEQPWYFNGKYHLCAFNQPPGTVLCNFCKRSFVQLYCLDCGQSYCGECYSEMEAHRDDWRRKHSWFRCEGGVVTASATIARTVRALHEYSATYAGGGHGRGYKSPAPRAGSSEIPPPPVPVGKGPCDMPTLMLQGQRVV